MKTELIKYQSKFGNHIGFCAFDDTSTNKRPVILICHDWSGRNQFADEKAIMLAKLGYIGFALDMYGNGQLGETYDEKKALMQTVMIDRSSIISRIESAILSLTEHPYVDTSRMAIIGFCFGGLCALDYLRSGANIKAAISFHGLLNPPNDLVTKTSHTKALILHGYDDPMVSPNDVIAFANEMSQAKIDWQIHMYGHTQHAFTNPQAHDAKIGLFYNEAACSRAFLTMQNFLHEVL